MNISYIEKTNWAGKEVYFFDATDSTNTRAAELAKKGCSHGALVIAGKQEAGKGRRGRSWSSEKGTGIYMSLVLRPDLRPDQASGLTLVAALSVVKAIEKVVKEPADIGLQIKWPNDVVVNKKKVCGILTEMYLEGTQIGSVVTGIGINVHQKDFPEEIKETATSLDRETGSCISRSSLIEEILLCFEDYYDKYLQTGDLKLIKQEYEKYLANKENKVKVLDPAGAYEGVAKGITRTGELIVDTETGEKHVSGGEVSVRGIYGYV